MASRVTSALLVPATLIAWLSPPSVEARTLAPPEGEGIVEGGDEDPVVDEAQQLFDAGVTKFETADYVGAIELWTEAFGLVPSVPENASIKAKLIANIAAAQERAYQVDEQISHLNQAKILLERYRSVLVDIYLDEIEREKELAWINERLTRIDAELEAVAEREAAERPAPDQDEPEQPEPRPPGRGLLIGGSVAMALEAVGLGIMIAGMVMGEGNDDISDLPTNDLDTRADRFRMGRRGNALAIAGAVGGGVLLGAGVALLVVGLQKRKAGHDSAKVTVVPTFDATHVGLGVGGRF